MGKGDRPEHLAPPDVFYNEDEARKYTTNSRMIAIQEALTKRALELLALPQGGPPRLLLDIGCGSGLSGEALSDAGHRWVGLDISAAMLDVAVEREVEGDVLLGDMGHGLPLRQGAFDGAISISAVQWLCNADRTSHDPRRRLRAFFETLYRSLARGARAVLQIYPEGPQQAEMLVGAAMRAGFSGGLVVDYPHSTRAKKFFLVLMVGSPGASVAASAVPRGKGADGGEPSDDGDSDMVDAGDDDEDEDEEGRAGGSGRHTVRVEGRARGRHGKKGGPGGGGGKGARGGLKARQWVLKKKAQMRARGRVDVPVDSKYTARKRKRKGL